MQRALLLACSGTLFAAAAAGCGAKTMATYDAKTIDAAEQMRKIAAAYNKAFQAKRRSPTADDLKPFLKQQGGDPDALLTSPRDGKSLVIVPGFTPDLTPAEGEQSIIAYERVGMDGKRMTVDIRGTVVLASDDEFTQIRFVGGHRP
jgi:hypothetical protein